MSLHGHRALSSSLLALLLAACGSERPAEPTPAPPAAAVTTAAAPATIADWIHGEAARVAASPHLAAINAEERRFEDVDRQLLRPWRAAWAAGDVAAFSALLAPDAAMTAFGGAATEVVRERGGVVEARWAIAPAADLRGDVTTYLATFDQVDHLALEVRRFAADADAAELTLGYDLRAVTTDGARRNDRGELAVTARLVDGAWRLASVRGAALETVSAAADRRPAFADATAAVGLDTVPVVSRSEAIRRGGYAMAVADYDGDLRPDVLLGHFGPMQLLRNTPEGFVDVTEAVGLRADDLVKAAAFVDLDNDGHRDIVLLRFIADLEVEGGDLVAYRNRGDGTFEAKGDILTRARLYDRPMPLAIADFDNNGFLDLYIGFPGVRDFTNSLARTGRATSHAAQGVWFNDGSWSLTEMPDESELLAGQSHNFPHAALVSDLDHDGDPDLVVIVDSGLESPVYTNAGGVMSRANIGTGLQFAGYGMAAASGDFDGDGHMDVVMTRLYFSHGDRIARSWQDRAANPELARALAENAGAFSGNVLYRNRGDGTFEDVTARAGLAHAGEAPAGVSWLDYDGDGLLDVYVTNGLWSGGDQEFTSLFFRLETLTDPRVLDHAMAPPTSVAGPNPFLDLLREFKGRLDDPSAPAADKPTLSFAGYQRNRLFRNNGDGTFTEVGYLEGADAIEDGYVAAAADFDGDGRQDLMLRNCDPAPGLTFPTVKLLRNQGEGFHTLTVFARGQKSNRDGIGAMVTAMVDGRRLVREIQSTQGAIQAEPVAYFGLGAAERVDALEVRWPSGLVERFEGVKAGRVMLTEGSGMIDLAGR